MTSETFASSLAEKGFLAEIPAVAIGGCRDIVVVEPGRMPDQPENTKGAWYYNTRAGEIREGISGPEGPVPVSSFIPGYDGTVDPSAW